MPTQEMSDYPNLMEVLERVFQQYQENEKVKMGYETEIVDGQMK